MRQRQALYNNKAWDTKLRSHTHKYLYTKLHSIKFIKKNYSSFKEESTGNIANLPLMQNRSSGKKISKDRKALSNIINKVDFICL